MDRANAKKERERKQPVAKLSTIPGIRGDAGIVNHHHPAKSEGN